MALVYDGNTLINQELIASGWVRYHSDQTSQTENVKASSQKAKDEKRGVYGTCQSTTNTKNPSCIIKGNIDQNKYADNKKYYLPNCAQYEFTVVSEDIGEAWFCTEKEAQEAGFKKAATCK
jgi:micrococcal nuclease